MEKRQVDGRQYNFISGEVEHYTQRGIISGDQAALIMDLYQVKQGPGFVKTVLFTGAVLVGLGVLSFIASNWDYIGKLAKYLIILSLFAGVNLASYMFSRAYPRIGASLLYLALLIYGGGIFLTGQIFNFGGHFSWAFMLWAAGVFPAAVLFRDKYLYIVTSLLLLVYLNGSQGQEELPLAVLAALPALYYFKKYLERTNGIMFFNNLLVINTVVHLAVKYRLDELYLLLFFLAAGLVMYHVPPRAHKEVFEIQGGLLTGIAGLFLTFPYVWETLGGAAELYSVIFTFIFLALLLFLARRENLIALVFICLTIFRYYVDLTYDFMPKSGVFISSGLLLLAFGYLIERRMKKRGVTIDS